MHSSSEQMSDVSTPSTTKNFLPAILKTEAFLAVKVMQNVKTSREDKFTVDILKEAGNETIEIHIQQFNKRITLCDAPKDWKNSIITLLFKKAAKKDIRNYRPISCSKLYIKFCRKF